MKSRKQITPDKPKFDKVSEYTINGRNLTHRQTEVDVVGIGRCVFLHHVTNPSTGCEWIDVVTLPRGKNPRAGALRSVPVDKVKTVHRTVTRKEES